MRTRGWKRAGEKKRTRTRRWKRAGEKKRTKASRTRRKRAMERARMRAWSIRPRSKGDHDLRL